MLAKTLLAPAATAALVASLIGFGGTVTLVVQALERMGGTPESISSAVTALCIGIALAGAILSFALRMPVALAWSTPGAALIAASAAGTSWPSAIGAFICAALFMIFVGCVPALANLARKIPPSVSSGMLVGVLLPFCLEVFRLAAAHPAIVAVLLAVYVVARQRVPLHALLLVLLAGVAMALLRPDFQLPPDDMIFGVLRPTRPDFELGTILSLGLPLFLVTLFSQNLPGLAVLQSAGYHPNSGHLFASTGIASLITSPFGAHGINLAAITAAICTSKDAHPDASMRWIVGVTYGGCYLALALVAPALVGFFLALPRETIAIITGLALVPALTSSLEAMLAPTEGRDPAILAFLAAGSGLSLLGLGAAFWGLVVGILALGARSLWHARVARDGDVGTEDPLGGEHPVQVSADSAITNQSGGLQSSICS